MSTTSDARIVRLSNLETDPRWKLVLRVAQSPQVTKSSRLKDFLLYVCQAAIEERLDDINEQKIGERVFGRPEHYNPAEDNIVRAQARLLRHKLEAHFATEGIDEPLILQIPKGGYVPEFIDRRLSGGGGESRNRLIPAGNRWVRGAILSVVALSLLTNVLLAWALLRGRNAYVPAASTPSQDLRPLWSQLFSDTLTTTILVPDSTYFMVQEASGQQLDLRSYLQGSHPNTPGLRQLEEILPRFPLRRYTTFDGLSTTIRVLKLAEMFPSKVVVRYARDVTLRDLTPGHVILLGRPSSNAWAKLFESKLNFRFDIEGHHGVWRNNAPQSGELSEYFSKREGNRNNAYGSVAFVPNVSGGNVLIIAGSNSASQEGAAKFVTGEVALSRFVQKIGLRDQHLPYFDALLRTTTVDEVSEEPVLVSYRVINQ